MKEKLNQVMNWVRDHRKRAAGIFVAFLLVIGAGIFGVVGVNSVNRAEAENKKTEETVNEPIYEMQEKSICSTCGADITGNTTAHLKETRHDGYYSEWIQVQTGTNTYTVEHPK